MIFRVVLLIFSPIDRRRFDFVEVVDLVEVNEQFDWNEASKGSMSESSEIEVMLGFLFKNIWAERRFALKMLRGLFGVDWTIESSVKLAVRLIDFLTGLIILFFVLSRLCCFWLLCNCVGL